MTTLNIITPSVRPWNLPQLADSLAILQRELGWCLHWWVMLDPSHTVAPVFTSGLRPFFLDIAKPVGVSGNQGRNEALEAIRESWVWFLDDDNDVHPEFGAGLLAAVGEQPRAEGFVFDQFERDGELRLRGRVDARPGGLDSAQFVFKREAIGTHRWRIGEYAADGRFFAAVSAGLRLKGVMVAPGKGAVWYNKLRR